ncbi:hypothetical protein ACWIW6_10720 [Ursidibacter sp. B-7004-1]
MSEIAEIISYNVLILFFISISVYVYLKWQHKKRIDSMLNEMEKSYLKYANHKVNERMQKKMAEYDKKHPFKAFKRKFKDKIKWLL